jgi:predicted nucleotidyltransferase component of viral defense system
MIGWLGLSNEQRRAALEQAGRASAINPKAIEKDWWVTLVLRALFEGPYGEYMIFKGGTSLSKCWSLIERLSYPK